MTPEPRTAIERVPELIERLYAVVDELETLFDRSFTPDGHLVGSIGEVLAAYLFDLRLMPASTKGHDARWMPEAEGSTVAGREVTVEIKCTQRAAVSFYISDLVPDHIVALRIRRGAAPEVVFNGPSATVHAALGESRMQKNGQTRISVKNLRTLDQAVDDRDRLSYARTFAAQVWDQSS